ncbi:MAG: hypothetical protein WEB37_08700 [Bacteroidota bacterium]
MAKAIRVTYFKTRIENKSGALLALVKDLHAKKLGLIALKGMAHGGEGEILVVAKDPEDLRGAWKASGILAEEGAAFYLSGADKTGALVENLNTLAGAGVNVAAVEAVSAGLNFGAILWVDPQDLDKAAQALGAK